MISNKLSSYILFSSTTERKEESKNVISIDKMYGYILAARKREQARQESLRKHLRKYKYLLVSAGFLPLGYSLKAVLAI